MGLFEKKQIVNEIDSIDKRLQNPENWNNHELMNQDLKKKLSCKISWINKKKRKQL